MGSFAPSSGANVWALSTLNVGKHWALHQPNTLQKILSRAKTYDPREHRQLKL